MSKYELRPHQKLAVKDIFSELGNSDRATYVSATGTGKTISLQHIAENSGNKIVAFFPSIMLVSQTILEWRRQYGKEIRLVAVCSDETVGNPAREDHMEVSDDELRADGAEVTRDPARIAEILKEDSNVPLVVFSTYHSANKVIDAQELCGIYFDLMVSDEAHYLAGRSALGRGILDSEKLLAKKRVFATATPKIVTLKQNTAEVGRSVVSMDEEELFGKYAHTYGLRDAINDGILSDYKIYIVSITKDTLFNLTGKTELKPAELRMALGLAAYERMEIDLGVKRSVVYLSNKSRAREFARSSKGHVSVITGEMPSIDRNKKLDVLRNSGGGIANVRCLTEGIDLPALDAVEFVDPRSSKIDIVQAVGRALRRSPGKEFGYVIIPVLEEPNGEDYGSGDTFKHVWSVLAQMAENDTKLSSEINAGYSKGNEEVAGRLDVDHEVVGCDIENNIINISTGEVKINNKVANELVDKIRLRSANINDPIGADFREKVLRLSEVSKELGRFPKHDEKYGDFLIKLRTSENGSKGSISLNNERKVFLNTVLRGWNVTNTNSWEEKVELLKNSIIEIGRLPNYHEIEYKGKFLAEQRRRKRDGRNWSDYNEKYMNDNIPGWYKLSHHEKWLEDANELIIEVGKLGRLPKNREYMGSFLSRQKTSKRLNRGWSQERQDFLDDQIPGWDLPLKEGRLVYLASIRKKLEEN